MTKRRTVRTVDEHVATAANEVWSWDITEYVPRVELDGFLELDPGLQRLDGRTFFGRGGLYIAHNFIVGHTNRP